MLAADAAAERAEEASVIALLLGEAPPRVDGATTEIGGDAEATEPPEKG
jgi:hypothetical protein